MKYNLFASIEEFLITSPKYVDLDIADKLFNFHILPMQIVRDRLGLPITASQKSGYRPRSWEIRKGRSGNSQHTFSQDWTNGSGAVDWTCKNFSRNKYKMLDLMIKNTNYQRICLYDSFIHADYKESGSGKRELFDYVNGKWKLNKYI